MEGQILCSIAIAFAVIGLNVPQTNALTVLETCAIVPNGTFIADPAGCDAWAYCLNGEPIYGKCGAGLFYDSASGVCNYADKVTCNTNLTTMCTGLTDVYKPDPNNCQNYCYCKNGVTYTASCPNGQIFNVTTPACVWSNGVTCSGGSPCLLVQNGFISDSSACNKWIRCFNGIQVDQGQCTSPLVYNAFTGKCDYTENVDCSSTPNSPNTPAETPTSPGSKCIMANSFIQDPTSCSGYFWCKAVGSVGVFGTCPKGSQFNFDTQQCNDPFDADPPCLENRCEGMTSKKFMAVADTACRNYFVCSNGKNQSVGECPEEYPVFNELSEVCQKTAFDYNICNLSV